MDSSDEDSKAEGLSVPSHYKTYTIQDRKLVVEQPIREKAEPGKSYDGPEEAKKIDLAEPR